MNVYKYTFKIKNDYKLDGSDIVLEASDFNEAKTLLKEVTGSTDYMSFGSIMIMKNV